jgi:TonB family protein
MTALTMNRELTASQGRFRRTLSVSLGVHALVLGWLVLNRAITPVVEGIVEVTWLESAPEPSAAPPAVAAAPVPAPAPVTKLPPQPRPEQKFVRSEATAAVEPAPQVATASRDLVKQRLEDLRSTSTGRALQVAPASSNLLASAATLPAAVPRGEGVALRREQAPASQPTSLRRGGASPLRATATLAQVRPEAPRAAAAAPNLEAAARRSLAGADLVGEVADRPVVFHVMPVYPDWAKEQAVEGTVTLRFFVLPDGRVKENIQVDRTAGFADFDANAVRALSQWRFAPLSGSSADQWGSITFRYHLNG